MTGKMQTIAQQVAKAASDFQQQQTGHVPKAATVVLSEGTLVTTLHGALTPAEQALAAEPVGAARVQESHRQLFASSSDSLRKEIKRITGVDVREAAVEIETGSGTVIHAADAKAQADLKAAADAKTAVADANTAKANTLLDQLQQYIKDNQTESDSRPRQSCGNRAACA